MTRTRNVSQWLAVVVMALGLVSCDRMTASPDSSSSKFQSSGSGRFVVLQGVAASSGGTAVSFLRVDSSSGETWRLSDDGTRWIGVEDELQRVGSYNSETKMVEWGVKLPDGRDLNELSKEELIRYLAAAIRNGQLPNPDDPLGIREVKK